MASASAKDDLGEKDWILEMHENLYRNVYVLTLKYPTTKEFNEYFKMDMFVHNNKAALQHVLHFLLNIYDPVKFKQNVTWPILDAKMETQFRTQVMKFVNEIRSAREDSGIPPLMTSHLISPGGVKFLSFIYSLSNFVLFEEISRNDNHGILLRSQAHANDKIFSQQLRNLETVVAHQFKKLAHKQRDFAKEVENMNKLLAELKNQKSELAETHHQCKAKLQECIDYSVELTDEFDIEESEIETKITELDDIVKQVTQCSKLIDFLCAEEELDENVDFMKTLQDLSELVESNKHILNSLRNTTIIKYLQSFQQLNCDSSLTYERSAQLVSILKEYSTKLEDSIIDPLDCSLESNSVLSQRIYEIFKPFDNINSNTSEIK